MTCPVCGGDTSVRGSYAECDAVYRRRVCLACKFVFFTTETESGSADYKRVKNERHNHYYEVEKEARRNAR